MVHHPYMKYLIDNTLLITKSGLPDQRAALLFDNGLLRWEDSTVDDDEAWPAGTGSWMYNGTSWVQLNSSSVTVSLHTDDPAPFAGDIRDMRKIDGTANPVFMTKPTTFDPVSVWARRSAEITFPEIDPTLLAEITALL